MRHDKDGEAELLRQDGKAGLFVRNTFLEVMDPEPPECSQLLRCRTDPTPRWSPPATPKMLYPPLALASAAQSAAEDAPATEVDDGAVWHLSARKLESRDTHVTKTFRPAMERGLPECRSSHSLPRHNFKENTVCRYPDEVDFKSEVDKKSEILTIVLRLSLVGLPLIVSPLRHAFWPGMSIAEPCGDTAGGGGGGGGASNGDNFGCQDVEVPDWF